MSVAVFRVPLRQPLDGATAATVRVDRSAGVAVIRLFRRRREHYVSLADVVSFVVWRDARAALREKVAAKKAKRIERRRGGR